jgi:FkbM family methyltransferase
VAGIVRRLQHAALARFPRLAWKLWHLKNSFSHDNEFEVEFLDNIPAYINRPQRTALDVGANFGVYTRALCRRFTTTHSVEPLPKLAMALRDAGPRNCVVHEMALGTEHGELIISVPHTAEKGAVFAFATARADRLTAVHGDCETVDRFTVKVAPLDDEFRDVRDIDFIKIDVEGSEMNVLGGGRQTLESLQPIVMIEAEKDCGPESVQIFEFLEGLGYAPYYYRDKKLQRTDRTILDRMESYLQSKQSDPDFRRYRDPAYIYNFIFCKPELVRA